MYILVALGGIDGMDTCWDYYGSGYVTRGRERTDIRDLRAEVGSWISQRALRFFLTSDLGRLTSGGEAKGKKSLAR